MSVEPGESVWNRPDIGSPEKPKYCPVCGDELAHRDDMEANPKVEGRPGLFRAYRRHRQTHYAWGDDPREQWDGDRLRDPYLAKSYDNDRGADHETDYGPDEDPDERVGSVYTVEINYTAVKRATVVAPSESRAKEKVKFEELPEDGDVNGNWPEIRPQDAVHTNVREGKEVTRADEELAERMEGWPW